MEVVAPAGLAEVDQDMAVVPVVGGKYQNRSTMNTFFGYQKRDM
jgi:hypothetical protein